MNRQVRAFTPLQRFYHRYLILLMFFFILTGLPILSDSFHWIAYIFSLPFNFVADNNAELLSLGLQVCRAIHRICALLLVLISIPFAITQLLQIKHWQMWPERWGVGATLDGIRELKRNYIDYAHPHFGKYNIGQKAAFWAFFFGMIAITVSGFVLWFRSYFSQEMVEAMRMTHDVSFIVIVVTLVFHVYFALFPPNRYGLDAMFGNGLMDEKTVRDHHDLWYDKIKGDPETFESRE